MLYRGVIYYDIYDIYDTLKTEISSSSSSESSTIQKKKRKKRRKTKDESQLFFMNQQIGIFLVSKKGFGQEGMGYHKFSGC